MVNAQMSGPARMMMETTTIHVGKFFWVDKWGPFKFWAERSGLPSQTAGTAHVLTTVREHTTGAPLTGHTATTDIPGRLVWRIGAHAIDIAILFVLFIVIWSVAAAFVSLSLVPYVNTAIVVAYAVSFETVRGQTLGKQMLRLRVRNQDGTNPTPGQALRRNVYFVLALLPGFIGGLITLTVIGWISASILVDTFDRQGIHDRFAGETFVTRNVRS
jgi:uncharacterized RDD family membrane protein YckC